MKQTLVAPAQAGAASGPRDVPHADRGPGLRRGDE